MVYKINLFVQIHHRTLKLIVGILAALIITFLFSQALSSQQSKLESNKLKTTGFLIEPLHKALVTLSSHCIEFIKPKNEKL